MKLIKVIPRNPNDAVFLKLYPKDTGPTLMLNTDLILKDGDLGTFFSPPHDSTPLPKVFSPGK